MIERYSRPEMAAVWSDATDPVLARFLELCPSGPTSPHRPASGSTVGW